jgi:hypothetical protein
MEFTLELDESEAEELLVSIALRRLQAPGCAWRLEELAKRLDEQFVKKFIWDAKIDRVNGCYFKTFKKVILK